MFFCFHFYELRIDTKLGKNLVGNQVRNLFPLSNLVGNQLRNLVPFLNPVENQYGIQLGIWFPP